MNAYYIILFLSILSIYADNTFSFREFTSADGRKLEARLMMFDGESATIETQRGKEFTLELSKFSEEDQLFIQDAFKQPEMKETKPLSLSLKQGLLHGPIQTQQKSSYFIYIPKSLQQGRDAPLYFYTSAGGGQKGRHLKALESVAEALGMVIAISVESSNQNVKRKTPGSLKNYEHSMNCIEHITKTLPVSKSHVIFGGNSGGAANAFYCASILKCIGVINGIGYIPLNRPPKIDYCYGICGAYDFNLYGVGYSTGLMEDNGFHRLCPGGHTMGARSLEEDGLIWMYSKFLKDNAGTRETEIDDINNRLLHWLKDRSVKSPKQAYHNALILRKTLPVNPKIKLALDSLINNLEKDSDNILYHQGVLAFNKLSSDLIFQNRHINSRLNYEDEKLAKAATALSVKYDKIDEFQKIIDGLQRATTDPTKKK